MLDQSSKMANLGGPNLWEGKSYYYVNGSGMRDSIAEKEAEKDIGTLQERREVFRCGPRWTEHWVTKNYSAGVGTKGAKVTKSKEKICGLGVKGRDCFAGLGFWGAGVGGWNGGGWVGLSRRENGW